MVTATHSMRFPPSRDSLKGLPAAQIVGTFTPYYHVFPRTFVVVEKEFIKTTISTPTACITAWANPQLRLIAHCDAARLILEQLE